MSDIKNSSSLKDTDLIMRYIRDVIFGVRTLTPAKVTKVTKDGDKPILLSVQPLLQETLNIHGMKAMNLPEIDNVPVWMPRTRKCVLTLPVEKDDVVALIFSDRSLDNWLSSQEGDVMDHQDTRDHDLSDAVAFLGFYPPTFLDPTAPVQTDFGAVRQIGEDLTDIVNVLIEEDGNIKISTKHTVNVSGGVINTTSSGNTNVKAYGEVYITADGDVSLQADEDGHFQCGLNLLLKANGDADLNADGNVLVGSESGLKPGLTSEIDPTWFPGGVHTCPMLGPTKILHANKVKVD